MSSALLYVLSLFILLGLSLWERSYPLYQYETDRDWHLRLFIFAGLGLITTALVGFILEPYIEANAASKYLGSLPNWLSGLVAYLIITFFVYWWHRLRHHNNLAWKIFHQVHHSTYRLQAITALYAHPTDFAANLLIINLVCYGLLGLNIESAAWATLWVSVFEYWEHTNVRTPRWLGYFIVRPEMHRIHHERNRHSNNYGLPLWDLIFGTYENTNRQVECGFELHNESRVKDMLACRQVE